MRRRPATLLFAALLVTVLASRLDAHDLFLKLARYILPAPAAAVRIAVLNGTFSTSENGVARDRLADLSVVGPDGARSHPDTAAWVEQKTQSVLTVGAGRVGTYVVGASVRPRALELPAAEFNEYLRTDGVPDVLDARRRAGEMGAPARERYSKHVKALFQVGNDGPRTDNFAAVLGYPAEIVPQANPYALRRGDTLAVRCLVDGAPAASQLVLAGGRLRGSERRIPAQSVRTDADGVARIPLTARGIWYVKFIHMVRAAASDSVDYESKWATVTFEVR
ncbi:MAG TPA: DUF4198 domain-containing protein [Gemmatimonadaceae bacterium]|nr:DUF4198 domain-containing protein [Gemmatimonadaceae bacterium]